MNSARCTLPSQFQLGADRLAGLDPAVDNFPFDRVRDLLVGGRDIDLSEQGRSGQIASNCLLSDK
jgi:hypothetical protein